MHSTLRPSRNQSSRVTLSDAGRRCACAGCLQHIRRLEAFNAQLAEANDKLRRDRDRLAAQLAGREVA